MGIRFQNLRKTFKTFSSVIDNDMNVVSLSPEATLGCASLLGVVCSPAGCTRLPMLLGCWVSAGEADVEGRLAQGGPLGVLSSMVWDTDTGTVGAQVSLFVTQGVLATFPGAAR